MDAEIETWWRLQRLLTRYATACDDRDWSRYRSVFAEGAWIDYTAAYGRAGTVDEIAPWMQRIMDRETLPSSQHLLANLTYDVEPGRATGKVHYVNPDVFAQDGKRRGLLNGGYYEFEAVSADGDWKLARLKATLLWSTWTELTTFDPPS